jgi:hypothetical protein
MPFLGPILEPAHSIGYYFRSRWVHGRGLGLLLLSPGLVLVNYGLAEVSGPSGRMICTGQQSCHQHRPSLSLATLRVPDQGPEISQEGRQVLFTRFGRLPGSRMCTDRVGMGLGLYLGREYAETMHGSLRLEATGSDREHGLLHCKVSARGPPGSRDARRAPPYARSGSLTTCGCIFQPGQGAGCFLLLRARLYPETHINHTDVGEHRRRIRVLLDS